MKAYHLVFALLPLGCSEGSSSAPANPADAVVVVTAEPVVAKPLTRIVNAVGTLNGTEEVTLAPKVDGRILAIKADVGDRVPPGKVLLELDPRDYDLAIAEAKEALAAELAKLGLSALPEKLNVEAVPGVKRAAATLEDATRRLKQKKDLASRGAASSDEVDIMETEWKIAEASKSHAGTEAQAVFAAAKLRHAALESAKQKRVDCTLTAPVPSTGGKESYAVASRFVSEGEMIRSMPVTNAFKLVLDHAMKLRVQVPEKYVADVKIGQNVAVTTEAYPNRTFTGKVTRVNPAIDTSSRTFVVEVEIANADSALKCGGFAKAAIQTKQDMATLVPPAALVSFAGVHKVFVLDNGVAKAVEVTVGSRDKEWIEVSGKIPADAKVITSGLTQIVDGTKVKIRGS